MKNMRLKIIVPLIFILLFSLTPLVSGSVLDEAREAGLKHVEIDEIILTDGPFFIKDQPYYILEYMSMGESKGSLVYNPAKKSFEKDNEIIRKALATRDLKSLTMWDPLFYSIGDSSKIPLGAKYETQNVRNFADFSNITREKRAVLETFLQDYERLASRIAETSKITNQILHPNDRIKLIYSRTRPNYRVEVDEETTQGRFSYEGFEELISAYDKAYFEYSVMTNRLKEFGGGLEEYRPGAKIREKFEVEMTKESILEEIYLVDQNGEALRTEIQIRKDILSYPYNDQIDKSMDRLGEKKKGICGPSIVLILMLLPLLLIFYYRKKPPSTSLIISLLLLTIIFVLSASPALSQEATIKIPTALELMSQKITDTEKVPIEILAYGIDEEKAREMLEGFQLIMEGESVIVRGPYYYSGTPNYFFDIVKDDESTGKGFLVDATQLRLVANQRMAFQLLKTRFLKEMIEQKPLFKDRKSVV